MPNKIMHLKGFCLLFKNSVQYICLTVHVRQKMSSDTNIFYCGQLLETWWLLTRTTGTSPLQMDTQVGSQVERGDGEGSASYVSCLARSVSVYVCVSVGVGVWGGSTQHLGLSMSAKGWTSESTLHPAGYLQNHNWDASFSFEFFKMLNLVPQKI